MTLPAEWEERYDQQIEQFEKAHQMEYITGMERRGIKKGIQKGERVFLSTLLQEQFPDIAPDEYEEKLDRTNTDTLLEWGKKVLKAKTRDEVFEEKEH